jgi:hypothetical protein
METLFPQFDWNNRKIATLFSENLIAQRFLILKDIYNYTLHLKKSIIPLHPKIIFPKNKFQVNNAFEIFQKLKRKGRNKLKEIFQIST